MTSDGTKCYHFNEANQLDKASQCSNNQTIAEYVYDYSGNRMVKKNYTSGTLANTVISWSDSYETKIIVGGATENTAYYFANGQLIAKKDKDGNKTYFHNDHLGSTSVITNQSGGLVESTSYDPWGEVKSGGTKSKFLYTGQEKDTETSLHYYNARYYDSHIRRFTQPDDVVQDVYSPQTLNRYSYAQNNPLKYTDPTGHYNILDYNKALTQYSSNPSKQNYTNISKTVANIKNPSNDTSKAGPATISKNNSGSSNSNSKVAGIYTSNQSSNTKETAKPNIITFRDAMKESSLHQVSTGSLSQRKANLNWFINKSHSYGDYDLKNKYEDCDNCEDLGNMMFGAVAREAGFNEYETEIGAGGYQVYRHFGKDGDMAGVPLILRPFGDSNRDNTNVRFGYDKIGKWY